MSKLRADPPLFDIPAWEAWLEELRADPPSGFRDSLISCAEAHIAAISKPAPKAPADAA